MFDDDWRKNVLTETLLIPDSRNTESSLLVSRELSRQLGGMTVVPYVIGR